MALKTTVADMTLGDTIFVCADNCWLSLVGGLEGDGHSDHPPMHMFEGTGFEFVDALAYDEKDMPDESSYIETRMGAICPGCGKSSPMFDEWYPVRAWRRLDLACDGALGLRAQIQHVIENLSENQLTTLAQDDDVDMSVADLRAERYWDRYNDTVYLCDTIERIMAYRWIDGDLFEITDAEPETLVWRDAQLVEPGEVIEETT